MWILLLLVRLIKCGSSINHWIFILFEIYHFSITAAPKIKVPQRFQDVAVFEKGEDIVLKIPFSGFPKPKVKWTRDTEEITDGLNYQVEIGDRHAFLTIKKSEKKDDGPYRLTLENELGTDSCVIKVQVNDSPDPPRYLQVESVFHDSVFLTWKPPNNDGGSFITQYVIEKQEAGMTAWLKCGTQR